MTPSSVSLGGSVLVQDTMLLLSGPEPRVLTSSCCVHAGKGKGEGVEREGTDSPEGTQDSDLGTECLRVA